jgi:hypothetical protein
MERRRMPARMPQNQWFAETGFTTFLGRSLFSFDSIYICTVYRAGSSVCIFVSVCKVVKVEKLKVSSFRGHARAAFKRSMRAKP